MCSFTFFFDESIGRVEKSVGRFSGVGSGIFPDRNEVNW